MADDNEDIRASIAHADQAIADFLGEPRPEFEHGVALKIWARFVISKINWVFMPSWATDRETDLLRKGFEVALIALRCGRLSRGRQINREEIEALLSEIGRSR